MQTSLPEGFESKFCDWPKPCKIKKRNRIEANPIGGIGSDDIHVATDEGENLFRDGTRVFNDDVTATLSVADVRDNKGAARSRGAEGAKNIEDMASDAVFLGNEIRRVVLYMTGLADELREEGNVGLLIEGTY